MSINSAFRSIVTLLTATVSTGIFAATPNGSPTPPVEPTDSLATATTSPVPATPVETEKIAPPDEDQTERYELYNMAGERVDPNTAPSGLYYVRIHGVLTKMFIAE